jgi:hypothetical protein
MSKHAGVRGGRDTTSGYHVLGLYSQVGGRHGQRDWVGPCHAGEIIHENLQVPRVELGRARREPT